MPPLPSNAIGGGKLEPLIFLSLRAACHTCHTFYKNKLNIENIENIENKNISGFSISSLRAKKNIENLNAENENKTIHSVNSDSIFNQTLLEKSWNKFHEKLLNKGRKNLASILAIAKPEILEENEISYTLTNETNKIELERNKNELLNFLKTDLTNNNIKIHIKVNKLKEKKFIYSPLEKYEKLKTINPRIESLRKEFKLNL